MKIKGNIESYSSNEIKSYLTDTGSADAYAVALTPAITAYTTGLKIVFQAANSNTGTSTLAVNGLSAKTIKKNVSTNLSANDIVANGIYQVMYDGTNFQMLGGVGGSGAQGSQGFQGAQGHQGFQGDQGNQGAQGFQGLTGSGAQGAQGDQGAQGNQGVTSKLITFNVYNSGSVIPVATVPGVITVPYSGTISSWYLSSEDSCTARIDIWKNASAEPTNSDSITASAKPNLSAAQFNNSSTLTGWTTSITAGDKIKIEVEQNDSSTFFILTLVIT